MTLRTSYFEQVVQLMRSWGFTFHEVAGCRTRDNGGSFNPTHFIEHHDASSKLSGVNGALAIVTSGRPGIEGMLSQFFANRRGEGFWVGSGQAWHAGVGGPTRGIPVNAANQSAVGLEVANDGLGEAYSPELDRFIVHLEAACMIVAGRSQENVFGHKEWTSRKSDPRKDMAARRATVSTIINRKAPLGAATPTLEKDDMASIIVNKATGEARLAALGGGWAQIPNDVGFWTLYVAAGLAKSTTPFNADQAQFDHLYALCTGAEGNDNDILARVKALQEAVGKLEQGGGSGVDMGTLETTVVGAVGKAIDSIETTVRVSR